jgi:hypothetical protein
MGDEPVTKAEVVAVLTPILNALAAQMEMFTTNLNNTANDINNNNANKNNININNNKNNPNRGGEPIPVIRVHNNNHTIVTYQKLEHTRESHFGILYEHRYYNKLKDDYYKFKISNSIYRCPFCYNNKDYSLTDLLRHAYRIAGNSCKTIKDIAKHSFLITYIQRYLNVKVDEIFSLINNEQTGESSSCMVIEPTNKRDIWVGISGDHCPEGITCESLDCQESTAHVEGNQLQCFQMS